MEDKEIEGEDDIKEKNLGYILLSLTT